MLRIKNGKLETDKIEQLRSIAALCPFEEGPAVYTARALLRGSDSLRQEYMHECEKVYPNSMSSRQSNTAKSNANNEEFYFSINPNPTKGIVNVNHNGLFKNLTVEETNGRIVFRIDLNQQVNTEQLDVSLLSNGLYLVKLYSENNIKVVKLILSK